MKKIICFDVNGTLVKENSWHIFTCGDEEMEKEIAEIFNGYYYGSKPIDQAWAELVSLLRKTGRATKEFIYNCWEESNSFQDGAKEILRYLKDKEYSIYLISCSIDIYLECMVKSLGLDGFYAGSQLEFDESGELSAIHSQCIKGSQFKKEKLAELAEKEGVKIEDIVVVGDGNNDVGVFEMTKHGIAMGDKNDKLMACAWKQINSLSEIKQIL